MPKNEGCICSGSPRLIFPCSGAADVGELADRAARKLTREGVGKMFCLAGIGGRVSGIIKNTEAAPDILAIDGCPLECAKKCLEEAGFSGFAHFRVTDLDLVKGKAPSSTQNIRLVADFATNQFLDRPNQARHYPRESKE